MSLEVLDVSAGKRMVWANRSNPRAWFLDRRQEVGPDVVADSRALPFADASFDLAVFDPPHANLGQNGRMAERYGYFTAAEITDLLRGTSRELHRVLRPEGLVAFKWNDHDRRLESALALMPEFEPLVCHGLTISGRHRSRTYWALLVRLEAV